MRRKKSRNSGADNGKTGGREGREELEGGWTFTEEFWKGEEKVEILR